MVHQFAHDPAEVLFVTLQPLNFMTSALRKSITLVRERVTIQLSPSARTQVRHKLSADCKLLH
ncbi:MAG: hypothetical protein ACTS45_00860 [Candidatus Hodgkinia cicadicola]